MEELSGTWQGVGQSEPVWGHPRVMLGLRFAAPPAPYSPLLYLEDPYSCGRTVDGDQAVHPDAHPPLAWEEAEGHRSHKPSPSSLPVPSPTARSLMASGSGAGKGPTGGLSGDTLTVWGELESEDGVIFTPHHACLAPRGGLQPVLAVGQAQQHPVFLGTMGQAHDLGREGKGREGKGREGRGQVAEGREMRPQLGWQPSL
jgi:hypothetical protein